MKVKENFKKLIVIILPVQPFKMWPSEDDVMIYCKLKNRSGFCIFFQAFVSGFEKVRF